MRLVPYSDSENPENNSPRSFRPATVPVPVLTKSTSHTLPPQALEDEPIANAPETTAQNPRESPQLSLDRLVRPEHAVKLPAGWKGKRQLEECSRELWEIIESNTLDSQEYMSAHKKLVALTRQLSDKFTEWQQQYPDLARQAALRSRTRNQQQEPTVETLTGMLTAHVINGCTSQEAFFDADNTTFETAFSESAIADYWHQPDYYNEFEIDLDTHCSALAAEFTSTKQRHNHIQSTLAKHPALAQSLDSSLNARLLAAGGTLPVSDTVDPKPTEKVLKILVLEKQNRTPEPEPTFAVTAVTTLHLDGSPSDRLTYHLPCTIDWPAFLDALRHLSVSWQATEAGHPRGYGPEDGTWWWQRWPADDFTELADERAYHELRRLIRDDKGARSFLLWHTLQRRQAEEAKRRTMDLRDRSSLSGVEPVDEEGRPVYERYFDLDQYLDRVKR